MIAKWIRLVLWLSGTLLAPACIAATSDSAVDTHFGTDLGAGGGQVRIAFDQGGSNDDKPFAVLRTAGGKYVLVSQAATNGFPSAIGLVRLKQDGSLDTSFGNSGKVVSDALANPAAAVLDAQERIVVVGTKNSQQFGVARFLANGGLDLSFAGTGSTGAYPQTSLFAVAGHATAVVIDPAGFIVAGGNSGGNGQFDNDIDFMWFTDAGLLDHQSWRYGETTAGGCASIDSNGTIIRSFVYGMAISHDGTIVAAGSCFNNAAVYVVNAVGCAAAPETGAPPLNGGAAAAGNTATGVIFDAWDRLLVVGSDGTQSFVTRLGPDLCIDPSFGGTQPGAIAGETYLDLAGTTSASFAAIAPRTDGSIIEVGSANGSMLVARLNNNGSEDPTFNAGQSYRTYPFVAGMSDAGALIIAGGKPVVAGTLDGGSPGGLDLAVLQLQSDLVFKNRFEPPK